MGWGTEHQPREGRRAGSGYWLGNLVPSGNCPLLPLRGWECRSWRPTPAFAREEEDPVRRPRYNTPATGKASNQRGSRRMFSVYLPTVKVIAMSQKGDYFYESRALWLFSPPEIIWKIPL